MRGFHETTAWILIVVNAAAGVLCLIGYRWRSLRGRWLWGLVIAGQALAFVQATSGAILSRQSDAHLGDMHALYGFSAIVAAMILYGYRTSPFMQGKELLLYGLGSLFIMGLGLRNLYLN